MCQHERTDTASSRHIIIALRVQCMLLYSNTAWKTFLQMLLTWVEYPNSPSTSVLNFLNSTSHQELNSELASLEDNSRRRFSYNKEALCKIMQISHSHTQNLINYNVILYTLIQWVSPLLYCLTSFFYCPFAFHPHWKEQGCSWPPEHTPPRMTYRLHHHHHRLAQQWMKVASLSLPVSGTEECGVEAMSACSWWHCSKYPISVWKAKT